MDTLKFKTTLKCSGCVATITPAMNETAGANNWSVDLTSPEKVLTVQLDDAAKEKIVIDKLQQSGYKAEKIS